MPPILDSFAHVLLPGFYQAMLAIDPTIPDQYPFVRHPHLSDLAQRRAHWDGQTQEIISYVNVNPEDYVGPEEAVRLCQQANEELVAAVRAEADRFYAGVAMLPMNHVEAAVAMIAGIPETPELVGVQLFTRALGQSLADPAFRPIFAACAQYQVPIWLHPVFDGRKPDNNIVFSWEYELSQTMLELVQSGLFRDYPDLKVLVHHAGGMVPFFAGRIDYILPADQAQDFRKFYVDTALLGNPAALALTLDYFGTDRVLFGTDLPLGVPPAGATAVIRAALDQLDLPETELDKVLRGNALAFVGRADV